MTANFGVKNFQYLTDTFPRGRRDQAEFHICCTTFQALQNGLNMFEKKAVLRVQIALTKLKKLLFFRDFP